MPSGILPLRAQRLGLVAVAVALWSAPATAQTLFVWPDTTANIEAYATIEECEAAVSRSVRYTASREDLESGVWTDTIPLDSLEAAGPRPLPTAVMETARRCGARFSNADSVSMAQFRVLLPLYLQAGWDSRARTLVERRLAAIGAKDDAERAAVLDSVFKILLAQSGDRIGAPRFALAEELADTWVPRVPDRVKRLELYLRVSTSFYTPDPDSATTARIARSAQKMAVIMDSLSQRELDELASTMGAIADGVETGGDFVRRYYALLNMSLGKRTFLDSLRHSTAAYVKLKLDNWARATGMRPETYKFGDPLGEQAPPIEADLWLGYDPARGPRPTKGRVSLVVFLDVDSQECNGGAVTGPDQIGGNCARYLNPLRRLEQRFPEIEITVVGKTYGYFLYLKEGMTPRREAELTKLWLEAYGVHAALAMATTASWRLPDPDSRRLSRPTGDRINYAFGKRSDISNGTAFLIDRDGIVVNVREMDRSAVYEDFGELIEILLHRQSSETAS
jgi:hypothetical protein